MRVRRLGQQMGADAARIGQQHVHTQAQRPRSRIQRREPGAMRSLLDQGQRMGVPPLARPAVFRMTPAIDRQPAAPDRHDPALRTGSPAGQ